MTIRIPDAVAYYDERASDLSASYDRVSFENVHRLILSHLPKPPAEVLDVGAASGRDAEALISRGFNVTAVEPAKHFREIGARRVPRAIWLDERLPKLSKLQAVPDRFDFILCSAVLMSVPPAKLDESFRAMTLLLRTGGKLAVSVRPCSPGDPTGILFEHSSEGIFSAARKAGLSLLEAQVASDAMGRGHSWQVFVFLLGPRTTA